MIDFQVVAILPFALLLDVTMGDPPNRFHPVAWMGSAIAIVRRMSPAHGETLRFVCGMALMIVGMIFVGFAGWAIQRICETLPLIFGVLVQALVLKCMFSVSSLAKAGRLVRDALRGDDVELARRQVATHLVSRDVSKLGAPKLAAATIESIAENTSDSVIAPLFYFAIAGLPGAIVYRFVNTCDAMIGYRTTELEWFGKTAARTDDVLNWVPSRITAFLMILVAGIRTGKFRNAIATWNRDHGLTASPNAGHPMSAAAGVLGVVLEKEEHYVLGKGQPEPNQDTIDRAVRLLWDTSLVGALLLVVASSVWEWAA